MISIPNKVIEEIADQLDCGMKCYIKKSTGALVAIIDDENLIDPDDVAIQKEIKQIRDNPSEYIEIENMDSRESYNVMLDFVDEVQDQEFQAKLMKALNASGPFRGFKSALASSEECRKKWFDYKKTRCIEHVKMQISSNLI
jgi:Uncharacterised protein family (UPF0158)